MHWKTAIALEGMKCLRLKIDGTPMMAANPGTCAPVQPAPLAGLGADDIAFCKGHDVAALPTAVTGWNPPVICHTHPVPFVAEAGEKQALVLSLKMVAKGKKHLATGIKTHIVTAPLAGMQTKKITADPRALLNELTKEKKVNLNATAPRTMCLESQWAAASAKANDVMNPAAIRGGPASLLLTSMAAVPYIMRE